MEFQKNKSVLLIGLIIAMLMLSGCTSTSTIDQNAPATTETTTTTDGTQTTPPVTTTPVTTAPTYADCGKIYEKTVPPTTDNDINANYCIYENLLACSKAKVTEPDKGLDFTIEGPSGDGCMVKVQYGPADNIQMEDQKAYAGKYKKCTLPNPVINMMRGGDAENKKTTIFGIELIMMMEGYDDPDTQEAIMLSCEGDMPGLSG
ncbi:MAG: hypothetical protein ABII22_02305 [Candidatus Micrarchaeota archaeon]